MQQILLPRLLSQPDLRFTQCRELTFTESEMKADIKITLSMFLLAN
ncbi:MAG: hypothetical protein QRY16_19580 [Enterobacterales bacterium endosymbiont of Blomia tropicalis]|nr:hypothetical protein [Mixta mediterraneensis]MBE5253788.1 hypothetical protein [Mixta mediterraneensis]MDL4915888.1 hypothetical protein [Mixta mediterraneensis]